jgi:GT2 family glycosyltransferase
MPTSPVKKTRICLLPLDMDTAAAKFQQQYPAVISRPLSPFFFLGSVPASVTRFYFGTQAVGPIGIYELTDTAMTSHGLLVRAGRFYATDRLNISEGTIQECALYGTLTADRMPSRVIDQPVVALAGPGHLIYGHWLTDFLPKLFLLHSAGLRIDQQNYLVPCNTPEFAFQLLRLLGIRDEQLIRFEPYSETVQARRMFVPTLLRRNGQAHPAVAEAARFLLECIQARTRLPSPPSGHERIFLSQGSFARDRRDRPLLLNRDEIECRAQHQGYRLVEPEKMTVPEQISLFLQARQIIGEYEPDLHNCIFSKPGVAICALRATALHPDFLESDLCQHLGQHIGYVFGASDEKDTIRRFAVDAADFELSMQLLQINCSTAVPAVACAQKVDAELANSERSIIMLRSNFDRMITRALAARDTEIAGRTKAERATKMALAQVDRLEAEHRALAAHLEAVLSSTFWRISWPIRAALERNPQTRRAFRRIADLMWRSVTFRLFRRLTLRRRAVVVQKPDHVILGPNEKVNFTAQAQVNLNKFLTAGLRLVFPITESPDLSVVIVLWNQAHLTLCCLQALLAQSGLTFEVVLVDNASNDRTAELLSRIEGARVINSAVNEGFLVGCNRGVAAARGRCILLLNSDAFVRPGAVAAAAAALDSSPDVGAVGARLVLPSGRLQEAGSIIWSDATTSGYGRGTDPESGEVMFRRDVDYCSAAFLLTPRALWNRLGGLDELYVPAYYEEADYCMRLRGAGYRVLYEPSAVVDHYEFGSEAKQGDAISACRHNRKRFRARYWDKLLLDHLPPADRNLLAARERLSVAKRRLLIIDNEVPLRTLGSGYPRARAILIETALAGWSVTLFPMHKIDVQWEKTRAELPWEIEIISGRGATSLVNFLQERCGHYDAVIVSRPDNMKLLRSVIREHAHLLDGTRLIYDAEALFAMRDITLDAISGRPHADATARIAAEISLTQGVDAVVCVSETEADLYRKHQNAPVYVLSHPTELAVNPPPFEQREGLLFVGRLLEQAAPNWQGLLWFVRECWPRIRTKLPGVTLIVSGHLHPEHAELEAPGIDLAGPVGDLRPLYNAARVFVAPVRFAAGLPIKILEATGAGLPTVGTKLMARQLRWMPGAEIAAEDDPAAFAEAVVSLYENEAAWRAMRAAACKRLEQEHNASLFRKRMRTLLNGDVAPRSAQPQPPLFQ